MFQRIAYQILQIPHHLKRQPQPFEEWYVVDLAIIALVSPFFLRFFYYFAKIPLNFSQRQILLQLFEKKMQFYCKPMQKSASRTQINRNKVEINYMTADGICVNVICVFACYCFFSLFFLWRMRLTEKTRRINEWMNERHLSCIGALQCVAECDLLPRFFSPWILALRNKHHVASSEMPLGTVCMCVGVRVVYFLLLLDSVLSRMFCANCVSAIIYNIQQKQSARTHKHTNTNNQQQLQSCQYWNFFFLQFFCALGKALK